MTAWQCYYCHKPCMGTAYLVLDGKPQQLSVCMECKNRLYPTDNGDYTMTADGPVKKKKKKRT